MRSAGAPALVPVVLLLAALPAGCARTSGDQPGGAADRVGSASGDPTAGNPAAAGSPPPAAAAPLEFADLTAIQAHLAGRRGRPVLVNFWATWCVPCLHELPDLAALAREYSAAGPTFVGVSLDAWTTGEGAETEESVKEALAEAGVGYPNFIYKGDQDPLLSGFNLPGPIPYSILYDGGGRKVIAWEGTIDPADLRRAVANLR
jgi:thiol-disulfide isomerase/thioredoxin